MRGVGASEGKALALDNARPSALHSPFMVFLPGVQPEGQTSPCASVCWKACARKAREKEREREREREQEKMREHERV